MSSTDFSEKISSLEEKFYLNLMRLLEITKIILDKYHSGKTKIDTDNNLVVTSKTVDLASNAIDLFYGSKKSQLLEGFIERSNLYWDSMINRNKEFLLNNFDVIVGDNEVIKPYFSSISSILVSLDNNDPDLDYVWNLIKGLIFVSVKYYHFRKNPDSEKRKYTVDFTVNGKSFELSYSVRDVCTKYNINLNQ